MGFDEWQMEARRTGKPTQLVLIGVGIDCLAALRAVVPEPVF
jgi:hypothetical protein